MPPRKNPTRLKQTTLFDAISTLSSSPAPSPMRRASTSKFQLTSPKSKRKPIIDTLSGDEEDSDVGAIKFEPKVPKSDLEEESPRPPKKKRKVRIVDSGNESGGQSNSGNEPSRNRYSKRLRTKRPAKVRRVVDSDEDKERNPPRRKLVKGSRPRKLSPSDDEADMADEVEEDRILGTRLRVRDKKTAFQKNLEKLKRRKQGKPAEPSGSEDEDEESDDKNMPFKGAKPISDHDSLFDGNSDDSSDSFDFIVEDDGSAVASLPMEFSMDTHQDLVHQFKKIFQFFVHIAVRTPGERHNLMEHQMKVEEYFSVPLQLARRKISGLRDSLVASSVWRPEFIKPLELYPDFELVPLDFAVPACDACHLGGRMSTLLGRLGGSPYDRLGFEAEESDRDSDDSDNRKRRKNKKESVEFHLGRFCAKRTRVFHDFTHWEYSLFRCIRNEVDGLRTARMGGGFLQVAFVGGKEPPTDLDDADAICDWLDERRIIEMEWRKVKDMMESARGLEMAAKRGGDAGD